jgi:hypothetical protein
MDIKSPVEPPNQRPIMKGKAPLEKWECSNCHAEQTVEKYRCGTCKHWRGGKRSASKKTKTTKSTPNNMELPPNNLGMKPKKMPMTVAMIGHKDVWSPLNAVLNINDKSFEESTIEWEGNASIDKEGQEINER